MVKVVLKLRMVIDETYKSNFENPSTIDPEEIQEGRWILSLKGSYVKCKRWRLSEGSYRFIFDGKVMLGAGFPWWIFIVLFSTTTTVVFTIFEVAPYVHTSWLYKLIGLFGMFFGISSVYTVFRVVLRDPGFSPVPSPTERLEMLMMKSSTAMTNLTLSRMKEPYKSGEHFCTRCNVSRPKRTLHCTICNACVERLDHHCPLFGTCIGRRNYGSFYLFLVHANALTFIGASVSLTNFISVWVNGGFVLAISTSPTIFVIMTAMILPPLGLVSLVSLLIVHTRLIATDVTLDEKAKGAKGTLVGISRRDKFNSVMKNFKNIVFAIPPPSRLNPREVVTGLAIRRSPQKAYVSVSKDSSISFSLERPNNESIKRMEDVCAMSCDSESTFTTDMVNIAARCSCGSLLDPFSIPPSFFSSAFHLDKEIMESATNIDMEIDCGIQKC